MTEYTHAHANPSCWGELGVDDEVVVSVMATVLDNEARKCDATAYYAR
jgi:hypothetical protein